MGNNKNGPTQQPRTLPFRDCPIQPFGSLCSSFGGVGGGGSSQLVSGGRWSSGTDRSALAFCSLPVSAGDPQSWAPLARVVVKKQLWLFREGTTGRGGPGRAPETLRIPPLVPTPTGSDSTRGRISKSPGTEELIQIQQPARWHGLLDASASKKHFAH